MSNVPLLGQKPTADEPMFRLLYCLVCDKLEELPPFDGDPEHGGCKYYCNCWEHEPPSFVIVIGVHRVWFSRINCSKCIF